MMKPTQSNGTDAAMDGSARMNFTSTTGKVPKGYGYILKPTTLVEALTAAKIDIAVSLHRSHSKRLFDADFWPPNPNVDHDRLYITAGTARSEDLFELRQTVKNVSIPSLVEWISYILAQDPKSPVRRKKHWIQLLPPRDIER